MLPLEQPDRIQIAFGQEADCRRFVEAVLWSPLAALGPNGDCWPAEYGN